MAEPKTEQWTIDGASGETVHGDTHVPAGSPSGMVLIAHGFKGYKDYGMFPFMAARLAEAGFLAHRFNFSHSGMTNEVETFARPELFERDTLSRQVEDLHAVVRAAANGQIRGGGAPYVMFGHSKGGVAVLLAAASMRIDNTLPNPAGVAVAAAPDTCHRFSETEQRELLDRGYLETASARTGQTLRIGHEFLTEQLENPLAYQLTRRVAELSQPVLVIHGSDDPTVPVQCGEHLAAAGSRGRFVRVDGADHVFNTPNPMPADGEPSEMLRVLCDALTGFCREQCITPA